MSTLQKRRNVGVTEPSPAYIAAFHGQRDWLRATLSSMGDAIIITNTAEQVTFLNRVAESLTGWTLPESLGKPLDSLFRLLNEETRQTVENPAARALREEGVAGLANHSLLVAKDGTERLIDESAAPIHNEKGSVAGVVLVFRDITERRQAERVLAKALQYADDIIATLRQPFVVLDHDLRVKTANRSFFAAFHISPEETENRFLFDLGNHDWDIPALRGLLADVVSQARSFQDFEVEHEFPALGRRTMLLNARPFPPDTEHPELLLLAIEDVTKHRRSEEALKHSEACFRRLFETAQDAILLLDARTGEITDANPYIQQLMGYSHAEFLGKQLWELGVFEDAEAIRSAFRELQVLGYIRFDHLPLRTKSGQRAEVEFICNVYEVDHNPVIQCNIRDISDRVRLLKQTQEQAVALSDLHRRKDEFLAMLSHELRNPLAAVSNCVQLLDLQKGSEDPIQREVYTIIERQVGQLTLLVDDLLEVSRITTGRIQLRRERIAVSSIVKAAVETARPLIAQGTHELTMSLPPQTIWLYADAARLEQAVVNLLTNAAKYTEAGGHIWLSVQQEGDQAVLRVRDTGVGIAPELLPRIFDLFMQSERSLARSQGGLGIGLSLVQRLVELHEGTVSVSSSLGHGSEFVVRLPVVANDAPQPPARLTAALPTVRPLRVLAVDDNVDANKVLATYLNALGHDVRTACDGPTGLSAALDYRPDVVLLDIGLPGMDGYEVAKRLREQSILGHVVLVAMSGYGQEAARQHSHAVGFDHHLVKPADLRLVQQVLASVVQKAI